MGTLVLLFAGSHCYAIDVKRDFGIKLQRISHFIVLGRRWNLKVDVNGAIFEDAPWTEQAHGTADGQVNDLFVDLEVVFNRQARLVLLDIPRQLFELWELFWG